MEITLVGSGIGGLVTGAFLARAGHGITIVEQHYQIGGYAHNFRRGPYTFEAAVHTVPMASEGVIFSILSQLGLNERIETVAQDEMFRIVSGNLVYAIPRSGPEIRQYLEETFPGEKKNLHAFFADLEEVHEKMFTLFTPDSMGYPDKDPAFAAQYQGQSYQSYLEERFDSDDLINLLGGQWPYVGITPDKASRLFMTMLFATHYFDGSHAVKGGFARLARVLADYISERGGTVLTGERVTQITGENKRARHVYTDTGRIIPANCVVANANPYELHTTILAPNLQSRRIKRRLSMLTPSLSAVVVYLGMKPGYEKHIDGNVIIAYDDMTRQSEMYNAAIRGEEYDGSYLVILKPKEHISDGGTLTLFTFADIEEERDWHTAKERIGAKMMEKLCTLYPSLKPYIDRVVTGSPETFHRYSRNEKGALYGFENSCDPFREAKQGNTTHLKNLYQCGHWSIPGCGIYNVVTNGFTAAQIILRDAAHGKL
ncbi:MAG: phytoene desaturase family protein [Fibrobacterota bacterium]